MFTLVLLGPLIFGVFFVHFSADLCVFSAFSCAFLHDFDRLVRAGARRRPILHEFSAILTDFCSISRSFFARFHNEDFLSV